MWTLSNRHSYNVVGVMSRTCSHLVELWLESLFSDSAFECLGQKLLGFQVVESSNDVAVREAVAISLGQPCAISEHDFKRRHCLGVWLNAPRCCWLGRPAAHVSWFNSTTEPENSSARLNLRGL
mgnify:CR=1 FL=1